MIKLDRKKTKAVQQQEEGMPKRSRTKADSLLRRYPPALSQELIDEETLQQHLKAIDNEIEKNKPRERVLLPLMKSTFACRCLFVRKDASNVVEILEQYPSLKIPSIVSLGQ